MLALQPSLCSHPSTNPRRFTNPPTPPPPPPRYAHLPTTTPCTLKVVNHTVMREHMTLVQMSLSLQAGRQRSTALGMCFAQSFQEHD